MDTSVSLEEPVRRLAVVLHRDLEAGQACNAAAIVIGGLRCDAFAAPVNDADGHPHAAIRWNMPILKARNASQLRRLLATARQEGVQAVAFTEVGQEFSNNVGSYADHIRGHEIEALPVVAVGLFGDHAKIRELTKSFSVFR